MDFIVLRRVAFPVRLGLIIGAFLMKKTEADTLNMKIDAIIKQTAADWVEMDEKLARLQSSVEYLQAQIDIRNKAEQDKALAKTKWWGAYGPYRAPS